MGWRRSSALVGSASLCGAGTCIHFRRLAAAGDRDRRCLLWTVGSLGSLFLCDVGEVDSAVLHEMFLYIFPKLDVCIFGEQAAWNLLGESLLFVVRVANGHVEHGLLESLVLAVRVSLDEQCSPCLEALGCKTRGIRSLFEVIRLDQMMLSLDFSE